MSFFRTNISGLVTYLRSNCTPVGINKTQELFYVGYPRYDPVEFPLVAITQGGGSGDRMSMGDQGNRYTEIYQVDIYTDSDAEADIGGGVYYTQNELVNYIGAEINSTIRDERCTITDTLNWIDIWISAPPRIMPYNEDLDLYRGIMRLTIQYNDPKT